MDLTSLMGVKKGPNKQASRQKERKVIASQGGALATAEGAAVEEAGLLGQAVHGSTKQRPMRGAAKPSRYQEVYLLLA